MNDAVCFFIALKLKPAFVFRDLARNKLGIFMGFISGVELVKNPKYARAWNEVICIRVHPKNISPILHPLIFRFT